MNTMETTTCPSCRRVGATISKQYTTVQLGIQEAPLSLESILLMRKAA